MLFYIDSLSCISVERITLARKFFLSLIRASVVLTTFREVKSYPIAIFVIEGLVR
jgi:hypothetical protein